MALFVFFDTLSNFIILYTWIILWSIIKKCPSILEEFIVLLNKLINLNSFINHSNFTLTFLILSLYIFIILLKRNLIIWKERRFAIKGHIVNVGATSCLISCKQFFYFFFYFFTSFLYIFFWFSSCLFLYISPVLDNLV